jgi:transmembrane sensor
MNQPNPRIEGLILRFLKKEASSEELLELQTWLKQAEENRNYFDQQNIRFQKEFVSQRMTPDQVLIAWEKMGKKIGIERKHTRVVSLIRSNAFKVAASVSIIALLIWQFTSTDTFEAISPSENTIVVHSPNRNAPIMLPDSTLVWLNANSTIEYAPTFSEQREVTLKGEGFFDVRKKGNQDFIVKTAHFSIQVKGTRFNVQAYDSQVEKATLEEGSIELKLYGAAQAYAMAPGDQITINNQKQTIERKKVNPNNFTAWKEDKLVFDNTLLSEIILKIENRYKVNIVIDDSLANRERLTMTIEHEPLEELLEMIHLSSQLNYKMENETITIYE